MRILSSLVIAVVLAGTPAYAQQPAQPTAEDLAAAKQAFEEGNALFKAGKLAEAVDKLKESYRLSKNAFLLYNIGHTYDQLGQKDMVLFYYRKFLASAPANAPMRANVEKRVAALEAENVQAAAPEGETAGNDAVTPTGQPPASKFSPTDFKHSPIFTAPPGWPIDVAAVVPADSGFTVKLFYRASGDASFTSKPMTWRNYELVARIPGAKATGKWVQYYIEVRDRNNALLTRSGKSTSPNLVNIERDAQKQYYADYVDEGGAVVEPAPVEGVALGSPLDQVDDPRPSTALTVAKWATTGSALVLFGTSMITYKLAGDEHDKLVNDSIECGQPPCRQFDAEFGQKVEKLGKRYETIHQVTLGVAVVTAGVATFLWVRDLMRPKRKQVDTSVFVVPAIGDGFAGAALGGEL